MFRSWKQILEIFVNKKFLSQTLFLYFVFCFAQSLVCNFKD